jgi:hypothetical protein
MINAVRLRPADSRKGFELSSYVSAATCTRYTAGSANIPATIHVVSNPAELAELSEIPQFQILTVKDEADLKALVQREMEERARGGFPAVHAYVEKGATAKPPTTDADKPKGPAKPTLGEVLRKKASETAAKDAENEGEDPTDHEDADPDANEGKGAAPDDKDQAAPQTVKGGRKGTGK